MRVLVQLSGGKDSVVTLYKAAEAGHEVTALYNDMGDMYPHVTMYVVELCNEWKIPLIISKPSRSVLDTVKEDGYPSDMLTIWANTKLFPALKDQPLVKLQSGVECCNRHLYQPMLQATLNFKPDQVWRGSKVTDDHVTAGPEFDMYGISGFCPIWEMTDEDVFEFAREHDIKLLYHYDMGVGHGLDCIRCTAWLNNTDFGRSAFTARLHPEEFKDLRNRYELISSELDRQAVHQHEFLRELRSVDNECSG